MKTRRRWLFRLMTVAFSLMLAALLAEAALWIFFPIPYDQFMVYIPDGHIRLRARPEQVLKNAHGSEIHINRLGFRGPEWGGLTQLDTDNQEVV